MKQNSFRLSSKSRSKEPRHKSRMSPNILPESPDNENGTAISKSYEIEISKASSSHDSESLSSEINKQLQL